jgi:hypothetical protein
MNDYLAETEFCDFHSPKISKLAAELKDKSGDEGEYALNAFYWVRDNICYFFEPLAPASQTLELKRGTCFTKSNLLAALLRASGISSRFQFQLIRGEAMSDMLPQDMLPLSVGAKEIEKYKLKHCVVNVKLGGRWLRADCTRDKYVTPDRANDWDGKTDTPEHPYLIKDLGCALDLKGYKKYTEPGKFKNLMNAISLILNILIDERRYESSGVRCLSEENLAQMKREIYDWATKAMELRHKGDARVMVWMVKRFFSKPLGLNIEMLEYNARKVRYLCHCCVPNSVYSYMGPYFTSLDSGMAHGINPKLEHVCRRGDDGIGNVEIINHDRGSYWLPRLEIMWKGLKNVLKR